METTHGLQFELAAPRDLVKSASVGKFLDLRATAGIRRLQTSPGQPFSRIQLAHRRFLVVRRSVGCFSFRSFRSWFAIRYVRSPIGEAHAQQSCLAFRKEICATMSLFLNANRVSDVTRYTCHL